MNAAIVALDRPCPTCGGPGPYYASQSTTASRCVSCMRKACATRYAAHKAMINATMRARRLAAIQALPQAQWTRRQRAFVERQGVAAGLKRCAYCWETKALGAFRAYFSATWHGVGSYCLACRRTYSRLDKRERRRREAQKT